MNKIDNAADPKQVTEAKHKERRAREAEGEDLRKVLSTLEGRRVMWRLMSHCGVFETVWENSARIHYNAGRQDVGHYIMQEIIKAEPKAFAQMMAEKQKGEI